QVARKAMLVPWRMHTQFLAREIDMRISRKSSVCPWAQATATEGRYRKKRIQGERDTNAFGTERPPSAVQRFRPLSGGFADITLSAWGPSGPTNSLQSLRI